MQVFVQYLLPVAVGVYHTESLGIVEATSDSHANQNIFVGNVKRLGKVSIEDVVYQTFAMLRVLSLAPFHESVCIERRYHSSFRIQLQSNSGRRRIDWIALFKIGDVEL
jgi:hypothetical protein